MIYTRIFFKEFRIIHRSLSLSLSLYIYIYIYIYISTFYKKVGGAMAPLSHNVVSPLLNMRFLSLCSCGKLWVVGLCSSKIVEIIGKVKSPHEQVASKLGL